MLGLTSFGFIFAECFKSDKICPILDSLHNLGREYALLQSILPQSLASSLHTSVQC